MLAVWDITELELLGIDRVDLLTVIHLYQSNSAGFNITVKDSPGCFGMFDFVQPGEI